ncbi:MAG: methionine--tRNA ligase [bacterium]|nr:methionine--tRNA ligase [Candidatus Microgenomates bacterium CPR3]MCQ3944728.1 methionine--tRNA ligase [bacterium]RIK52161.1 MAG: methionine--tRNA ligase [Candidatus Microgenomates bacterium]
MQKYYITTTAPYVNSDPHIGFALEIIQADALARYHELKGEDVFFNTGTDEHGKKIYEKAVEDGKNPKEYVDIYAAKFRDLKNLLGLSDKLNFSRTTDDKHILAAQEMWRRVESAGYIRKGTYSAKYCVGCELEKQDSELIEGKCPLHPNKEIELINEENYFFCFSKLQDKLLEHYDRYQDFVIPAHRQKEIRNFVESGLTDFSISRLKEKMPWGVPVPGDESQVMYVWFDALTYYISALGWPSEEQLFENYWGKMDEPRAIQVAGKDNLRQQTSMWQAMLMAAGLPPSRQVVIHGFITSNGQKISKSLGNKVDPVEYVNKYGVDALRYYLLAKIDPFEDSDFTREKFEEVYRADLQNGLGNLVSRVAAMASGMSNQEGGESLSISKNVEESLNNYRFDEALRDIWMRIKQADQVISEKRVWELEDIPKQQILSELIEVIVQLAVDLRPFLPMTADKILSTYTAPTMQKMSPLFPRLA